MQKRKLKIKCTHINENTESTLEAEFESEEQVDQSSQQKGLVSAFWSVVVGAVVPFVKEVINYF